MRVCVIGGGASGMMCATMIARKGHNVTLYEKNDKLGKKIYITGKGRCNVTNATTGEEFLKNVVNGRKFVMGAITRFNSTDLMNFFEEVGIKLKIERGNRVFPESDKASDITKGLERAMTWAGVKVKLNSNVEKIEMNTETNQVKAVVVNGKNECYDAVVVATGGITYPSTGSTGDGYNFAKAVGHTVIEPKPALCAIISKDKDIKGLQGLSLKNVKLTTKFEERTIYVSQIGEMLFTDSGISGPIVLSASSYITRCDIRKTKLYIDFKPALSEEILFERINREIVNLKSKQFSSLLELLLPKSLAGVFSKRLKINLTLKANQLTKENRKDLINLLKNFEITPEKLDSFNNAVITSGGVNLKEINPKFMNSKFVKNLYFIGEVLDIDAMTGGFNLQLAFSTAVTCASAFNQI